MSKDAAQNTAICEMADEALLSAERFNFGAAHVDQSLGQGLLRSGVHEIFLSRPQDVTSAVGFTLALALRAAGRKSIFLALQDFLDTESGGINAAGLNEMGLDPSQVILLRAHDAEGVLRAGEQAARCAALGAVVIAPWGDAKILDFTASRRLALASAKSNVPVFLLRAAAKPSQSAASTRWSVRSAPSRALEANAPGFSVFELTLLRHREGMAGHVWRVEWDREQRCVQNHRSGNPAQVSGPVVAVSRDRQAASAAHPHEWRRAG